MSTKALIGSSPLALLNLLGLSSYCLKVVSSPIRLSLVLEVLLIFIVESSRHSSISPLLNSLASSKVTEFSNSSMLNSYSSTLYSSVFSTGSRISSFYIVPLTRVISGIPSGIHYCFYLLARLCI